MTEDENNNLIINGGFDEELFGECNWKFTEKGGWYTEGKAVLTDSAYDGENAAMMNSGIMYQRVTLEKGVTYQFSLYVRADKDCNIDEDIILLICGIYEVYLLTKEMRLSKTMKTT